MFYVAKSTSAARSLTLGLISSIKHVLFGVQRSKPYAIESTGMGRERKEIRRIFLRLFDAELLCEFH